MTEHPMRWEAPARKLKHIVDVSIQRISDLRSICITAHSKCVICGTKTGEIVIMGIESNQLVGRLQCYSKSVYAITVSKHGRLIASGFKDKTVRFDGTPTLCGMCRNKR